jgi:hypothetical protein
MNEDCSERFESTNWQAVATLRNRCGVEISCHNELLRHCSLRQKLETQM